jgi:uncharacterized protein DUF4386
MATSVPAASTTAVTHAEGLDGASERDLTRRSLKRVARLAGVFYLFVGIFGFFSEGYADLTIRTAGDAAATAAKIAADPMLVRLDVMAHLLDATFFIFTAIALFVILRHVQAILAGSFVVLVAVAAGIISLNAISMFGAMLVATEPSYAAALGVPGSNSLVLLLTDLQHYGTLAAQVFFGLWLAPLGYLAYKSGLFPKGLGIVLVVATVSYLVDVTAAFLFPAASADVHKLTIIAPAIAEPWMVLYLLIFGVRSPRSRGAARDRAEGPTPAI